MKKGHAMELPAKNEYHTFADCLKWEEADRIEIIYAEAYMMSPPMADTPRNIRRIIRTDT